MSTHVPRKAVTPAAVLARKGREPLVCLTAYTTPMARLVDAHADVILVGDSLGMVVHGLPSTVGVTTEMMILHGQAVRRGTSNALLVVDMPFGSYEAGPARAFETAARIMTETGCAAVKLEGGETMAETIAFLTARSIPVMAHVGLMPQQVNTTGGYRVQGRGADADRVLADARRWPRPARSRWCWKRLPSRWRGASPRRSRFRPSASAPRPHATARSS